MKGERALALPWVYDLLQTLLGAKRGRERFAADFIRARPGDRILDIGCGTARILDHLPDVDYHGFDPNEAYIEVARRRYAGRGTFTCGSVTANDVRAAKQFDVVLAVAVLHHLSDAEASALLSTAAAALRPGGRLVTLDAAFTDDQSPIARFLARNDRGRFVRTPEAFAALASRVFGANVRGEVRHKRFPLPYTYFMMVCSTPE